MSNIATGVRLRALSTEAIINTHTIETEHVRVEFLRCRTPAKVSWNIPRPNLSLLWVRDKGSEALITRVGETGDTIPSCRSTFWFFPVGMGAEGELTGKGPYDCAGLFVDPAFLSPTVKEALSDPICRFEHKALGRAFNEMNRELMSADKPAPFFTEGWAMQALAYVARAAKADPPRRVRMGSGLAPWQLRRAKEMLCADLSEDVSVKSVAKTCGLSVCQFTRGFRICTGKPPHEWLVGTRIEAARDLLAKSDMPLAEIAVMCGFSDQSHFSRVFRRFIDESPAAWRREQKGAWVAA